MRVLSRRAFEATADCREKQKNEASRSSRLSGKVSLICCSGSHTPGIVSSMFYLPALSAKREFLVMI